MADEVARSRGIEHGVIRCELGGWHVYEPYGRF
jgi:hypothetical protein